jgi:tRNA/rRNA methyltransferase
LKRVVLCRPSGPRNVGSIARTCANFGNVELVLAAPERPSLLIHPEFEQMAHGVTVTPEKIRVVANLTEALDGCTWSYGFTARVRDDRVLLDWTEAESAIAERVSGDDTVALVFGNEVSGLSGDESSLCAELVRLPTGTEHTSLNLSMAVGVVLFSLFDGKALATRPKRVAHVTQDAREYLILHLKDVLGNAALSQPAREDIEESVERVFRRAVLETRDARAWHAILRALGNRKVPSDYGLPLQLGKQERMRARDARAGGDVAAPAP